MPRSTCRSPSLEKRFQRFAARGRGVAEKGEGASQERLRALPPRPGVSAALLRPAARLAPRPAGRLRAARVHCRPAQPTRRPSARRARADRGSSSARSEGEGRGTRNEARGTRRDEVSASASGGRAVKEWCCWMRGARACRMGARHGSLRLRMFKESRKQWDCPGHAQVRRDAEPSRVVIAKLLFMLTN